MKTIFLPSMFFISSTFASESGGHHGHVTDLMFPIINVVLLFGFLTWKLKKPMSDFFKNKSLEISQSLERANLKSKEAQVMMDTQERKNNNLNAEIHDLKNKITTDVLNFEKVYSNEIYNKIEKMKLDAVQKVEAEKKSIINDINAQLLDEVIQKAKLTIRGNEEFQKKASHKLIEGISR